MSGKKKSRKEAGKKESIFLYIEAAVVLIAVLVIVGIGVYRSSTAYVNEAKAIEINQETYSLADVNYFYYSFYNNYCEEYASFVDYMIDDSKSLKEQEYEDGVSWFSYFLEESLKSMICTVEAAREAEEAGYVLSEEGQRSLEASVGQMENMAEITDQTPDELVKSLYGSQMTMERYAALARITYLAEEYASHLAGERTYSKEACESYVREHPDSFVSASYERAYVKACDSKDTASAEQLAAAGKTAEKILQDLDKGTDLKTAAEKYNAVYFSTDEAYYSPSYAYGDWLFKEERTAGDRAVIEDKSGCYVMVFRERGLHSYPTVNIRDLAFAVDPASENREELLEAACDRAETLKAQWEAGGSTEEAFIKLIAEEIGTDPAACLKKQVTRGVLDKELESWCFSEERAPGDAAVLYTEKGFHLVYFCGWDIESWQKEAMEAMRAADANNWYEGLMEKAVVKRYDKVLETAASALA